MKVVNVHCRTVGIEAARVYALLEEMGTGSDRVWPAPRMPFRRTPGPLRVGTTEERHGIIRAVLDRLEPQRTIVWRARLPFLVGTHGFALRTVGHETVVEHRLEARLAWWFVPVWTLKVARIHDRLIEALFDRLEAAA